MLSILGLSGFSTTKPSIQPQMVWSTGSYTDNKLTQTVVLMENFTHSTVLSSRFYDTFTHVRAKFTTNTENWLKKLPLANLTHNYSWTHCFTHTYKPQSLEKYQQQLLQVKNSYKSQNENQKSRGNQLIKSKK